MTGTFKKVLSLLPVTGLRFAGASTQPAIITLDSLRDRLKGVVSYPVVDDLLRKLAASHSSLLSWYYNDPLSLKQAYELVAMTPQTNTRVAIQNMHGYAFNGAVVANLGRQVALLPYANKVFGSTCIAMV